MATERDIEQQIEAALAGRRSWRPVVRKLLAALDDLSGGFGELVQRVEAAAASRDAGRGFSAADPAASVRHSINELLLDQTQGRGYLGELSRRLAQVRRKVEVIDRRVRRDTVNIGVIGISKAGKSTLLRSITHLPEDVIPSSRLNPTTAALSRIYNQQGSPSARLLLHDWHSFQDGYLAPLHKAAGCGSVPATLDAFANHDYPHSAGLDSNEVPLERFRQKLRIARSSLPSYRRLLAQSGELSVAISELRPYVAYPRDGDPPEHCPYHAVREVHIRTEFPALPAAKISLVDLPGAGEAGLDVDRHFGQRLRNDVDLLLMVIKPAEIAMGEADWTPIQQAAAACGGVALNDFLFAVINRQHQPHDKDGAERYQNACQKVGAELGKFGVTYRGVNVANNDEVRQALMMPVLKHLAGRLAEMDRAALVVVRNEVDQLRADLVRYAEQIVGRVDGWLRDLPDQQARLRKLADNLRLEIGVDLLELAERYAAEADEGVADPELERAVSAAAQEIRGWVRDGLGFGDRQRWLAAPEAGKKFTLHDLTATEDEYARARFTVADVFGQIDDSLDSSTERLRADVAAALRKRLPEELIPNGPGALEQLQKTAEARGARTLAVAIDELNELWMAYGSVLLRVARPIIRKIVWNGSGGPSPSEWSPSEWMASSQTQPAGESRRGLFSPGHDGFGISGAGPAPADSGPGSGPGAGPEGFGRRIPSSADELYDDLTAAVEHAVTELDKALHAEAVVVSAVLAAAANLFLDTVVRKDGVSMDYEYLCAPYQQSIWPEHFDGGTARLSAELTRIGEAGRSVLAATAQFPVSW